MPRAGMNDLIDRLRRMTGVGTASHEVQGVNYYTDDDLQEALDRHSRRVTERMAYRADVEGGSVVFRNYHWQWGDVETASSGTARWLVQDTNGSAIGTADYTAYYGEKRLQFDNNTSGTVYTLLYHTYDVYRAAADIYDEMAGRAAAYYDVQTDGHNLKRSQMAESYRKQARAMLNRARPGVVTMRRGDVK